MVPVSLRKKCPSTEFFPVRIFLYLVRMQERWPRKKFRIWTFFPQSVSSELFCFTYKLLFKAAYFLPLKVFKNGPSKICGSQPFKIWRDMFCLSRPYTFKFFKGCLPQILLGPLLNTLSQMLHDLARMSPYSAKGTEQIFVKIAPTYWSIPIF